MAKNTVKAAVWLAVADLIAVNPVAAVRFCRDNASTLGEPNVSLDWLGMADELEVLAQAPLGQPTEGDGRGEATTFTLMDAVHGEVIDTVTVTGPGDRLGTAWDEFAERHDLNLQNVPSEIVVVESTGVVGLLNAS